MEDEDNYAMFLDFSKACDKVEQYLLFDVVVEMNLGDNFIAWFRLLYNSPVANIMFNGTMRPTILPIRMSSKAPPVIPAICVLPRAPERHDTASHTP
ncbi:hypothetical protein H310_14164 [Aphanomyces invadans]|uniref:Reverse transcriptase domain-containing protein n=1 Tax=Aphanomyces invadans TaxID=157072 RepID=A0A024TAS6_9STRA|nr:hypothetical protein H310_14164 [Aphanomyces invadans]ETV91153.1 hypothetical protein H310_14164 [Aphanomyces invadans]|eukprot:XP_008880184.1 hypothetical protein H310_14164 [Aphanomyces invadans]